MKPLLCIYHGNCADGFTSAWIVKNLFPDTEFVAADHGDNPPDCAGRAVLILDFSYKRPVLLDMASKAESITILDHHVSAEKELTDLPENVNAIFNMNKSGAMITWHHFHEDIAPLLVRHVQDSDLWRFDLEDTKHLMSYIHSLEFEFEVWDKLANLVEMPLQRDALVLRGKAIHDANMKNIRSLIKTNMTTMNIGGHEVPALNAPHFYSSEAGAIMAEGEPFAACYWDSGRGREFSLRSAREGGLDVSEIAASYGGGGHKHAAGFSLMPDHDL